MAQSTPLSQLPPINGDDGMINMSTEPQPPQYNQSQPQQQNQQQFQPEFQQQQFAPDNDSFVNEILADMGEPPSGEPSHIDNSMLNRAMDRSQVPLEKRYDIDHDGDYGYFEPPPNQDSSMLLDAVGISNTSSIGRIYNMFKFTIIVFILCFLICLPQVNRQLFGLLPNLLLESGQVSLQGVALKSGIVAILFYVISIFI